MQKRGGWVSRVLSPSRRFDPIDSLSIVLVHFSTSGWISRTVADSKIGLSIVESIASMSLRAARVGVEDHRSIDFERDR